VVEIRIDAVAEALTHEEWEQRVREDRVPPDALVRIPSITGDRFVPAASLASWRALRDESARRAAREAAVPPLATALLVGVQIRLWTWARVPEARDLLTEWMVNFSPAVFEDRELWRPLTMGLLQVDLLHAFMNLLWSFFLGWILERTLGRVQLLVIFVTSVLTGSLFSTFASPWTPSLGSSGGVFGLVGAVVTFGIVRAELVGSRLGAAAGLGMLPYLLLTFWSGLSSEGVDNWCHLGGMLAGLLLGLLLDPPHAERRPGWNRRVWAALGVALALVWGTIGVAGPSIQPLWEAEAADAAVRRRRSDAPRPAAPEAEPARSLRFQVPGGWRRGRDLAGRVAYRSPVDARAFGVRAEPGGRPVAPDDVLAELAEAIRRDWPSARFAPAEDVSLAGHAARRARGTTGGDPDQVVEIAVAARGVWTLVATWEVPAVDEARLRPLRDRLLATVRWDDPEELVRARADHAARPTRATRIALAAAEAAVGNREAVDQLHGELLAAPDPQVWQAVLSDQLVLGDGPDAIAGTVARLLASDPAGKAIVAAADALETAGAAPLARGLLIVAWERAPGDRALQRARRARRLSTLLTPDGQPWDRVHDLSTRRPRAPAASAARAASALDLGAAEAAVRAHDAEREGAASALRAALAAGEPDAAGWLSVLARGDDAAEREEIALLVDEALQETPPEWLPPTAAEAVRARAAAVRAWRPGG
jgi:membrane associated rhomboid family serine protease